MKAFERLLSSAQKAIWRHIPRKVINDPFSKGILHKKISSKVFFISVNDFS